MCMCAVFPFSVFGPGLPFIRGTKTTFLSPHAFPLFLRWPWGS